MPRLRVRHVLLLAIGLAAAAPAFASATGSPSPQANRLVASLIGSGDTHGLPFMVIDKVAAEVFAYDGQGKLIGSAAVLVGAGRGDVSPTGIGTRRLADIPPAERITPAGRFQAAFGRNIAGKDILWLDYDAALSLHRVITTKPSERRLQRLATPTPLDNRISYGCINVPAAFYEGVVLPLFRPANGIVYILPEAELRSTAFDGSTATETHRAAAGAR